MKAALEQYAQKIASGEVSPVRACAQQTGWILKAEDRDVPLLTMDFGKFLLSDGPFEVQTGEREWVVVPVTGAWRCEVAGRVFEGERAGGPFGAPPGESNAEAIYLPRGVKAVFSGDGEICVFSAPAYGERAARHIAPGEKPSLSRGWGPWRRFVVTLVTPDEVSTNLVVGETWSPPGGWSGTPLHTHDEDNPDAGESDHEEVYYHLSPLGAQGITGCHTVQLLMHGSVLNESYVVRDRTAVAIPGGSHPVVASPVAPALYVWGLAGRGSELAMADVPSFAFLHKIARDLGELERESRPAAVEPEEWDALLANYTEEERQVVEALMLERGFRRG